MPAATIAEARNMPEIENTSLNVRHIYVKNFKCWKMKD